MGVVMRFYLRAIALVGFAYGLAGCVTTSMQGYADREAPVKPIRQIATFVSAPGNLGVQIQTSAAEEARKRGVVSQDALGIFPPTRTYTNAEIQSGLAQNHIDALLIINVGDTGVTRQYAGTVIQSTTSGGFSGTGTTTQFGNIANTNFSGTMNSSTFGTATPVYRYQRQTNFNARLVDAVTGRNLWVGSGQTQAGGSLFVGDGTSASSSISALFNDLQTKGIIRNLDQS
jgi:hypothetical protein